LIYNTAMKLLERADVDPENSLLQIQDLAPLCRLVTLGLELSRLGQPPHISPSYVMTVLRGARRALDVVAAAGKLYPDELMSTQRAVGLQAFVCVAEPQDAAAMREYARVTNQTVELEQLFAYAIVDKYFYEEAKYALEEMFRVGKQGKNKSDPTKQLATTPTYPASARDATSSGYEDGMHKLERSHKLISSNIQQLMLGCDVVEADLHSVHARVDHAGDTRQSETLRSFMDVAVFTPLRRVVGRCIAFEFPIIAQMYFSTLKALQDEVGAVRPLRDDLTAMELR
jgi:hypothetical protein